MSSRTAVAKPKIRLGKVERNPENDWIVIDGTHEPLVSPELFDRAQRLLLKSRSGSIGEAVRRSKQNSPYLLSGLIRCDHCGAKWQGYRVNKGRKKPGTPRIATLYYACGGYVSKGNAVCKRALIAKDDFEQMIVTEVEGHIRDFHTTGGAALLEGMVAEVLNPTAAQTDEKALRARLVAQEARIGELVACLTPAMAATLEPKIVALQREADQTRASLEDLKHVKMSVATAGELVSALVTDLGAVAKTIATATFLERRDIVRAMTQEIVLDPESGEGEVTFFGIPKFASSLEAQGAHRNDAQRRIDAPSANEKRTPACAMSSCYQMAGARHYALKRTFRARIIRHSWVFAVLRRAA